LPERGKGAPLALPLGELAGGREFSTVHFS
jgi:hypothetical protein